MLQVREVEPLRRDFGPERVVSLGYQGTAAGLVEVLARDGVVVVLDSSYREAGVRVGGKAAVSVLLEQLASQLDGEPLVLRRGETVYRVGLPGSGDLDVRVLRSGDIDAGILKEMVSAILSKHGRVSAGRDRIIVQDVRDVIARVDRVYGALVETGGQYVVQVQFVELNESDARTLGVDWNLVGTLVIKEAVSSGGGLLPPGIASGTAAAGIDLEAILRATEDKSAGRLITSGRVHVSLGRPGRFVQGLSTPIEKPIRSIDGGGVITTEVEYVQSGLVLNVGVDREPSGRLKVSLSAELSDVVGTARGLPIKSELSVTSSAVVEPGGLFLLGGFHRDRSSSTNRKLPGLPWWSGSQEKSGERSRVFIVCRVVIPGGAVSIGDKVHAQDLRRRHQPEGADDDG